MKKIFTIQPMPFFLPLLFVLMGVSLSSYAGEIRLNGGQTEISFTANGYQSISFRASISSVQFRDIQTPFGIFTELFVQNFGDANIPGDPKLPVARKLLEIPLNASFRIQVTKEQFKEYDLSDVGITHPIIPAQAPVSKETADPGELPFVYNRATYQLDQWLGAPLAQVAHVGILRSLNLGRVDISPIQYNPVTRKIRVYEILEATVVFETADIPATLSMKKSTYSPYFNNLNNLIFNYQSSPDSLITSGPVTYVIISPIMFYNTLQPFIKWKKEKGFNVIVGYTSNPAVGTTTTSIKNYLQGLYNNPPNGYNRLSFVLFIGDIELMPAWNNVHPSDMYSCEYTGDSIPDVFYGRFSAKDQAQLQVYIDKTVEYEKYLMPDDSFLGEVSMIAGFQSTQAPHLLDYVNGHINYATENYLNIAHNIFSHTYLQPEPYGANYDEKIRADVSNGVALSNYTAHGGIDGWGDPRFFISDIPALQNNHKYCLMIGNSCNTSNFSEECFGEEITRTAGKGALGYIGCTGQSYGSEDYWWACGYKAVVPHPPYDPRHLGAYDGMFHDYGESTSQWFVTMGQMLTAGNLAVEESNSIMAETYWVTYCLLGDPSLSVYFSIPPPVTAIYPPAMPVGTTNFVVHTEPYAYVAMTLNDATLLDAKCADLSGIVNLSFPGIPNPGTAKIVITKQNRKPDFGTVNIVNTTGPYIVSSIFTINDSTGNNNQKADYDESLMLTLPIKNIGIQASSNNVIGTIETADTNIIFTSNTFNFGIIPAQGSTIGYNAFGLTVKNNVKDQSKVNCNITFSDGTGTWTSPLFLVLNAPRLNIGDVAIQDPAPGGNGNGILDPGESATLKIAVSNSGNSAATNTIAHLTVEPASRPYLLVSNPSYFVGSLNPGSANASFAFFQVTSNGITPAETIASLNQVFTAGQQSQYSKEKLLNIEIGQMPNYTMSTSTVSTCGGKFLDSGGLQGEYNNLENFVMTFLPGTFGAEVNAVFSSFEVEPDPACNFDWLKVFDGPSITSQLLGTYCGDELPGPFASTTGALTFQFSSDWANNANGWVADVSCIGGQLSIIANAFPSDLCTGGSSQLVVIPSGGNGTFTYEWTPSTYLDDPTSRTPISTPSTDIIYTVKVTDGTYTLTSGPIALTIHPLPPVPTITESGGNLISSASMGNQWFINGAMIPGADQPIYTPTASGTYHVSVTDPLTLCESLPSNAVTFLMMGIDPHSGDHSVTVYPNPFTENLTITYELPESGSVRISLADMFGKESRILTDVAKAAPGKHSVIFSGNNLTPGIYYLVVRTSGYLVVKKILLKN